MEQYFLYYAAWSVIASKIGEEFKKKNRSSALYRALPQFITADQFQVSFSVRKDRSITFIFERDQMGDIFKNKKLWFAVLNAMAFEIPKDKAAELWMKDMAYRDVHLRLNALEDVIYNKILPDWDYSAFNKAIAEKGHKEEKKE